jgi:5'(3')-deoxyribonucleotidase
MSEIREPEILCDVDGVLANFDAHSLKAIRQFIPDYELPPLLWDYFKDPVLKPIISDVWEVVKNTIEDVQSLEGAKEGFFSLRRKFPHTTILTSGADGWFIPGRIKWLQREMKVSLTDTIYAHKKYLVDGDMLIDDRPKNIRRWASRRPTKIGVLWTTPRPVAVGYQPKNVVRTDSWDEVEELAEKLRVS